MTTALVITAVSPDRPGLVEALAQAVVAHGGNWEESRMARLAGHFAGILLVRVPDTQAGALIRALQDLQTQGLAITVENSGGEAFARGYRALELELIGQDRPGIIHDIARALGSRGVSVEDLVTECISGSMSGENLFKATARLRVPEQVAADELRAALEGLADELMVDIVLEEPPRRE